MISSKQLTDIRQRQVGLMQKTLQVWQNVISQVTQEEATTYRDGPDGWTVLEVLGHIRDFDGFFLGRAKMMLEQDMPQLPRYDHEAIAIEQAYNKQDLQTVIAELTASREAFIAFFQGLDDEQWERAGIHPERGEFNMLDAAIQVGGHDVNHLEQVTRILKQREEK